LKGLVRLRKRESESRNTLFLLWANEVAISLAASILLSSIKAGDFFKARPKSSADFASPDALIIALFLS
jgi:hypothetical protein